MGSNKLILKLFGLLTLTTTLLFYGSDSYAQRENQPNIEIIIIDEKSVIEQHQLPKFVSEANIKKILRSEGIIPSTLDWLEVTLLCEKHYTHLKNEKYRCIYKYSKIINDYNKTKKYCDYYVDVELKIEVNVSTRIIEKNKCMEKYGFSDPDNWKSYRNPLIKNTKN